MKFRRMLLMAFLLTASPATFSAATEPAVDTQLAERLSRIAQESGSSLLFEEYRSSSLFAEPVVYTGRLTLDEPGQSLTKWIDSPEPGRMTLTVNDVETQTGEGPVRRMSLRQRPEMSAFVASMLALMQGDAASLTPVFDIEYSETPEDQWQLVLLPVERRLKGRVSELRISGQAGQIEVIQTINADETVQRMEIIHDPANNESELDPR
jgi:outer membrane lipoprotein-sorting protein